MEEMEKKYGITDKGIFVYAVGDGNNSLATAKLHYDNLKRTLSEQKLQNHPARYTLAEIVNIHDDSFDFEPINRVVFGVDTLNFLQHLGRVHNISFTPQEGQQYFDCVIGEETRRIWIADPSSNVVTGTVQNFIDHYIQEFSGKVDYVHGENIVRQLAAQVDNVGILFPSIPKESLFETSSSMASCRARPSRWVRQWTNASIWNVEKLNHKKDAHRFSGALFSYRNSYSDYQ